MHTLTHTLSILPRLLIAFNLRDIIRILIFSNLLNFI